MNGSLVKKANLIYKSVLIHLSVYLIHKSWGKYFFESNLKVNYFIYNSYFSAHFFLSGVLWWCYSEKFIRSFWFLLVIKQNSIQKDLFHLWSLALIMNDKVFWLIAYETQFPKKKLILVNMIYKAKWYTSDIVQGKQLQYLIDAFYLWSSSIPKVACS